MTGRCDKLLIVGDSIALGVTELLAGEVRTTTASCFIDRLRPRLTDWRIEVDAALHRTTNEAVGRLPELLCLHRPTAVLFVLGGNDLDINWKRFFVSGGRRIRTNTPVEAFEANLRSLVATARDAGATAVLSDLPAPDVFARGRRMSAVTGQDFVALIRDAEGGTVAAELHRAFSECIDRVASDTHAPVARWAGRMHALDPAEQFGPDAVHPGEAAHALIADTVAGVLATLSSPTAVTS